MALKVCYRDQTFTHIRHIIDTERIYSIYDAVNIFLLNIILILSIGAKEPPMPLLERYGTGSSKGSLTIMGWYS